MLPYVHTRDLACVHVKFMCVKGFCYVCYSSKIIMHHSNEVLYCLSVRQLSSAEWRLSSNHCVFSNLFWLLVQPHCHLGQHWIVGSLLWHLLLPVASDSPCPGYVRRGKTVQYSTRDNRNCTNLLLKINLRKNADKMYKGFPKNMTYHYSVFKIDKKKCFLRTKSAY